MDLQLLEDPNRTPAFGWFVSRADKFREEVESYQKACPLDSPANIKPWAENATQDTTRMLTSIIKYIG